MKHQFCFEENMLNTGMPYSSLFGQKSSVFIEGEFHPCAANYVLQIKLQ